MELLVTVDKNYILPLQVMLTSLYMNNPGEDVEMYLLHSRLQEKELEPLEKQCGRLGYKFFPVKIEDSWFSQAPVTKQYPREMYYRLLAPCFLPQKLHRILYLAPDILVINSLKPLWETDMKGRLFAAAAHTGKTNLANNINQVRLGTTHKYFNSGVLLINLDQGRKEILPEEIFRYAGEHAKELLLPDQDILNAVFGSRTLELDDYLWNYDARNYSTYLLRSGGVCDMDWVMGNTGILHFCGKTKPWQAGYIHRFGILYKHYMQINRRLDQSLASGFR
ncbi:MAG TPA: glycosyltransferase family 8 protein [Candidatus Blautia merdigallinarum]|uniref:Glycosyltransferase family 8 protein n=1 Tax=Candidatus Blautia merdigallinarum TaxID=2838495 RepID=A0A9D2N5I5_9FIRM|nr:glycosyltransferase family 8 protein [Candidatus Blautia merdigallinarum]